MLFFCLKKNSTWTLIVENKQASNYIYCKYKYLQSFIFSYVNYNYSTYSALSLSDCSCLYLLMD